ncbi:AAA family ATPase [Neobacillus sp. LXY-4]|uniref:AAA family ATPase n=1 Tax=Neobacillus sp. LXY-4 TaxID=3379826 RepID=UPI003EE0D321
MKKNFILSRFEIEELNGETNVSLTFDDNIRILLGENGTGKTTILTTLYYVLARKFNNLFKLSFKRINLYLNSGEVITLEKEWFSLEKNRQAYKYYKFLEEQLSIEELDYALDIIYRDANIEMFRKQFIEKIRSRDVSFVRIKRVIIDLKGIVLNTSTYIHNEKILEADKRIGEIFNKEILYFPTYRRIEEDLAKLGLNIKDKLSNNYGTINFGMDDVQEIFNKIKSAIRDESLQSYSNVTGNMIKHLIYPKKEVINQNFDMKILEIVLDRFGNDLDSEDKFYISELIKRNEIINEEYSSLNFYLVNLVNNYMKYKERDDSIKEFARICSKYLVNKTVYFNESNGELSIINLKSNKEIELNKLSSGEKQIVSILAQVFLKFNNDFIILFDEPELSLSIEWQEMLLPDIINSGKCTLLLAVTHSPFIFDNSLDSYAKGIELFIEEIVPKYE